MPTASRYENWHHLHIEGDKAAAQALVPLGRKVLGYVAQQAEFNGLMTHKAVHQVEGGEIVAEVIGGIPRVTIRVLPPEGEVLPRESRGGFIIWPHWGHVEGEPFGSLGTSPDPDNEYPQAWLEFFGRRKITHYRERWDVVDDIVGSTYQTYTTPDLYPEGMRYYGNVEWKSDEVALTWYGCYSRYFRDFEDIPDRYQFVMTQGQLVLWAQEYAASLPEVAPDWMYWPITSACHRQTSSGRELVVVHTDIQDTKVSTVAAYDLNINIGTQKKGDWIVTGFRELGVVPAKGPPARFYDARVAFFFSADGRSAVRIIDWPDVPTSGDYYGTETIVQTLLVDDNSISLGESAVPRLFGDYTVDGPSGSSSGYHLTYSPDLPVMADYRNGELVTARVVWKQSTLAGLSPSSVYQGTVDFVVVLAIGDNEVPLIERRNSAAGSTQDYHLPCFIDLRHNIVAGWRVRGTNGVHTAQAYAWLNGTIRYGDEIEAAIAAAWLPGSVTDTRATDVELGAGLLFGVNFWSSTFTPDMLGEAGVAYGASPRTFFADVSKMALMVQCTRLYGIFDSINFAAAGSWCYNDGAYCLSMPGPNWVGPLNYITGGNLSDYLGTIEPDTRYWPITTLPKPL